MEIVPAGKLIVPALHPGSSLSRWTGTKRSALLEQIESFLFPFPDKGPGYHPVGIIVVLLDDIAFQRQYGKIIEVGFHHGGQVSSFGTLIGQVNIEITGLFRHYLLV